MLTTQQKRLREEISEGHVDTYASDIVRFLRRYVTMDEVWVYHYDPETKEQSKEWRKPEEGAPRKFRVAASARKILASVFWDADGIIMVHYHEKGETITANVFCDLLVKLKEALKSKRRGKLRSGVLFHMDNAPAHKARKTLDLLADLGFEIMSRPPYSPDLAPSDYFLFPKLKSFLKGKRFACDYDVMSAVNGYFEEQDKTFYKSGIEMLFKRYDKFIKVGGDYVEK